jgi:DNA (cytosine-5)-methyltransferase 1
MRVLSLFSGVGGFDMGLEAAGMTTVFQCELDKNCRQTLDHHWAGVPKWDDVSTLTGRYILDHCDGVDVFAWGSPCQYLSVAGKRAGLTGERSGLFHQGIRIIKELRELSNGKYPTWSIWENVAGALSSNNGADFGEVLYEMDEAGACFSEWSMLDAQYFGVPQRRRRVFVLSCFDPSVASRSPEKILTVGESSGGNSAKGKQAGQGATTEAAEGFGNSGFSKWAGTDQAITLSARDYKGPNTLMVEEPFTPSSHAGYSDGVGTLRANGGDLGGGQRDIVGSLQARDYKGVGNQYVMENKLVVQQTPPSAT